MTTFRPLSASAVKLKALVESGAETKSTIAGALRCDQSTVSKWLLNGATPTVALAVAVEERWPDIGLRGWLEPA